MICYDIGMEQKFSIGDIIRFDNASSPIYIGYRCYIGIKQDRNHFRVVRIPGRTTFLVVSQVTGILKENLIQYVAEYSLFNLSQAISHGALVHCSWFLCLAKNGFFIFNNSHEQDLIFNDVKKIT